MSHSAFAANLGGDIKSTFFYSLLPSNTEINFEEVCTHGGHRSDVVWSRQPQSNIHRAHNRSSSSSLPAVAQQLPHPEPFINHRSVSFGDLTDDAMIDSSRNSQGTAVYAPTYM
jgi:hypothetical protein